MNVKIILGASCAALVWITIAGTGATQGWVDFRIAQQETNTQTAVDGKIHSASNAIINEAQRRIDEHVPTNGLTRAELNAQLLHDLDSGIIKARAVLSDPSNTNAINEATMIILEATYSTAQFLMKAGTIKE